MFKNQNPHQFKKWKENLKSHDLFSTFGRVTQVVGNVIEITLTHLPLGARVKIFDPQKGVSVDGEIVGFKKERGLVIPYQSPLGVSADCLVECVELDQKINVGDHFIGRIIDAYGNPLTGDPFPPNTVSESWPIIRAPLNPMLRKRVRNIFDTGIRSLNGLLTFGEGQRMGIMAGSGVGKSVLLGMISKYSSSDINIIALIGERGREVREFIEENLGEEGLKKSIVVVSTGDDSPLSRIRAAHVATALSEYYRERGKKVLLLMDSLTRIAMAQREIGLSVGEPPTTKGYTPSVFSLLPKLLERAGNSNSEGSLTAIYTVLVEGDDFQEPICDHARGILDGHILLSRKLAQKNHFPAIDILASASRVMIDISSKDHLELVSKLRDLLAEYEKNEDLINIGAYHPGTNKKLDQAIQLLPKIETYLKQNRSLHSNFSESFLDLQNLFLGLE